MTLIEILALALSLASAVMIWMMGNKSRYAPMVGVGNQVLWITYCVITEQWGLLPGTLIYLVVHIRNWIKWNKVEASARIPIFISPEAHYPYVFSHNYSGVLNMQDVNHRVNELDKWMVSKKNYEITEATYNPKTELLFIKYKSKG